MPTPPHIVPEWYFLPIHAILRSIPDKAGGVAAIAPVFISLLALPFFKEMYVRSSSFRPIHQGIFWLLLADCLLLGWIGCQPVEAPFVTIGQIPSVFFFLFFAITPIPGRVGRGIPKYYTDETDHTWSVINSGTMNLRVILHNEFTSRWVCNGRPISWKEFSKQGNEATDNVPSGRSVLRDWLRLLLSLFTNLQIGELVNRKCALARFIFLVTRAVACLVIRSEGAHPLLGPWKWDNIGFWYLLCQQALVQSLLLPGLIPKEVNNSFV